MYKLTPLLLALALTACQSAPDRAAVSSPPAEAYVVDKVAPLIDVIDWTALAGEYNNHEQVWAAKAAAEAPAAEGKPAAAVTPVPATHWVVREAAPSIYTLSQASESYSLALSGDKLSLAVGSCTLARQSITATLLASVDITRPALKLKRAGDAVALDARRVRYFSGWGAMKRLGKDAPADNKDWIGVRGLVLHTEGDKVLLTDSNGKSLGYAVELAQLTYQNTQQPILKFAIIDERTQKSLAYSWAETDATRIGINLGWIQAGFALHPDSPHFKPAPAKAAGQ
jgi:hypothetical protein